jgi:hypothetical protein
MVLGCVLSIKSGKDKYLIRATVRHLSESGFTVVVEAYPADFPLK